MGSQILDEKEIQQIKSAYMSDRTTYIRGLTEIEPKRILITDAFMERNTNQLGFVDKWTPLANYTEPKEKHLHKLKMINAQLAMDNGMLDIAEETLISAWDDVQVSRGDKGFFQKELNMERHDIHEERQATDMERKVGFFGKLLGGGKSSSQQQQQGAPPQ